MKHFLQLPGFIDPGPLLAALQLQQGLWNSHEGRKEHEQSPHRGTSDLWLRYNDLNELKDDYKEWTKQHDSIWLPAARFLPQIRPIIFSLMARVEATRLGGVLLTRVPPGGKVLPHADVGWHPRYYNMKVYVPLAANPFCRNRVLDESVVMAPGELWYFDNTLEHEVVNEGDTERITLITCMRIEA